MKLEVLKKSTVSVFQRTGNDETTYLNNLHPPEPEFQNGRNITFPPVTFMKYPSNLVTTLKYSIFTWAPKSLIWQFRRVSNVYFLIISILSAMPFSPKNPFSVGGTSRSSAFVYDAQRRLRGLLPTQARHSDKLSNLQQTRHRKQDPRKNSREGSAKVGEFC